MNIRMNIKDLSLQKILGDNWTYNPDFQYADFDGRAELHKGDRIILFRRKDDEDISVVSFQAVGLCDKELTLIANKMLEEIGINLRMGDSRNRIVKNFGIPDFIDCIEEGYYRYLDYNCNYSENFLIMRYHYLIAPDLLVCFGIPKENYQKLTDLEIVNDLQMVSSIMESRIAYKKLGNRICSSKDRLCLVHQTIENRSIEGIQSKIVHFFEAELKNCTIEGIQSKEADFFELKIENCTIEGIQSEYVQFANCVFENVEFKNYYRKGHFSMESCTFINCIFRDSFGASYLYVAGNLFQNCLFDGIRTEIKSEGAYLSDNEILNCNFQNMVWVGYGLYSNIVSGGKIEHVSYNEHGKIYGNQFSDVQMKDIEIEMEEEAFSKNKFNAVIFRNVILKGKMEKNNKFINCDTSGFANLLRSGAIKD